ncbi:D-erythrulose reductase-like [Centruroides sculpturatus]|uniref:D-erythrulose reductase-like n=1 Tax=Centruroides sculpturatus TaxID=218467 RepID=UPI000C6E6724|nr:D-erythrulose reductase-like [Centruroides sculpturatus]
MELNFEGKRALVTGASRGIGRGIAIKLNKLGVNVVAISKSQSNLEALKREVPSIEIVAVDLSDWNETSKVISQLGTFHYLVNSAGNLILEPLGNITAASFEKLFDVNVKAVLNVTQIVANEMKKSGIGGSIVNISSVVGNVAFPGLSVYPSTKGALNQLTKTMAIEYGPHNIRVNAVAPCLTDTDMARDSGLLDTSKPAIQTVLNRIPLQRFAEVNDIVDPVIFLLSDMARYITGSILNVDGGYTA